MLSLHSAHSPFKKINILNLVVALQLVVLPMLCSSEAAASTNSTNQLATDVSDERLHSLMDTIESFEDVKVLSLPAISKKRSIQEPDNELAEKFRTQIRSLRIDLNHLHNTLETDSSFHTWDYIISQHTTLLKSITSLNFSKPYPVIASPLRKKDKQWGVFSCLLQSSEDMIWVLSNDGETGYAHNHPYVRDIMQARIFTTSGENGLIISTVLIPRILENHHVDLWCRGYHLDVFRLTQSKEQAMYDNSIIAMSMDAALSTGATDATDATDATNRISTHYQSNAITQTATLSVILLTVLVGLLVAF